MTVADPSPGQGASHAAAGMLTPVSEATYTEKELFALGAASLERYPGFVAELTSATGEPTGFRRTGTLQVGYDADDLAVIDELHALQDSLGFPGRRLTARECRRLEPMLDPSVRGGLLAEADGSVDPRLLTRALLAAAAQAGVRLIRQPVAQIIRDAERAWPGRTDRRRGGDRSAGRRRRARAAPDGSAVSVSPTERRSRRTGPCSRPAGTRRPSTGSRRTACRRSGRSRGRWSGCAPRKRLPAPDRSRHRQGLAGLPRAAGDGELVVGATQEELGPDTRVTAGGLWELLRDARALVPGITELESPRRSRGCAPERRTTPRSWARAPRPAWCWRPVISAAGCCSRR